MNIENLKELLRNRLYMAGVERTKTRTKSSGEVFTPTPLVQEIMDQLVANDPTFFDDYSSTFLDPSCGDGQFLSEVMIRKMENGSTFEQALSTVYGVDLMPDNVKLCQDRLLCGQEEFRHIVEKNIVEADGLTYHYRFDGTDPYLSDKDLALNNQGFTGLDAPKVPKVKKTKPVKEPISNPLFS